MWIDDWILDRFINVHFVEQERRTFALRVYNYSTESGFIQSEHATVFVQKDPVTSHLLERGKKVAAPAPTPVPWSTGSDGSHTLNMVLPVPDRKARIGNSYLCLHNHYPHRKPRNLAVHNWLCLALGNQSSYVTSHFLTHLQPSHLDYVFPKIQNNFLS